MRAAALARALAGAVANDVARGRDPEGTIDDWIRRIAAEIAASTPAQSKPRGPRRLADILPEVH